MKYSIQTSFFAAILLLIVGISGCDPCKNALCINGVCNEGICDCEFGWEGAECAFPSRSRVIGSYLANEQCDASGAFQYSCSISESSLDSSQVYIKNLFDVQGSFGISDSLYATVDSLVMTIPSQTLQDQNGQDYTFSGAGTYDLITTTLTLRYAIVAGGIPDSCTSTLVKQ